MQGETRKRYIRGLAAGDVSSGSEPSFLRLGTLAQCHARVPRPRDDHMRKREVSKAARLAATRPRARASVML